MLLALLLLFRTHPEPTFDGTRSTPRLIAITNGQLRVFRPGSKEATLWAFKGYDVDEPAFSPDGTRIAYGVRASQFAGQKIWVADAEGVKRKPLTKGKGYDQGPTWSPDGRYVLFVRQGTGLMAVETATAKERKLADGWSYAWSPNGNELAVLRKNPNLRKAEANNERGEFSADDIWILDRNLKPKRRVTTDGWYAGVEWFDDRTLWAKQVGPGGYDGDGYQLRHYWIDVGSKRRESIKLPGRARWEVLSPDRRKAAYCEEPSTLYVIDFKTGKRRIIDKDIYPSELMWTRDGKWLYFHKMSNRPKNMYADTQQVWRADTSTWRIEQISTQPDSYARFLFDPVHSTAIFRTESARLALSNSRHKLFDLGTVANIQGITAWWGWRRL